MASCWERLGFTLSEGKTGGSLPSAAGGQAPKAQVEREHCSSPAVRGSGLPWLPPAHMLLAFNCYIISTFLVRFLPFWSPNLPKIQQPMMKGLPLNGCFFRQGVLNSSQVSKLSPLCKWGNQGRQVGTRSLGENRGQGCPHSLHARAE